MGKKLNPPDHGNKKKVSVTPSPELLAWVMERVGDGKEFASVTHAVERGWAVLREIEEGKWVRGKGK
jgi:hypothetical protein